MPKLTYRILGRRIINTDAAAVGRNAGGRIEVTPDAFAPLEAVDVEWSHADGPFPQHKLMIERLYDPATGELKDVPMKVALPPVPVIWDQINVRIGSQDSLVMAICEEKRQRLAECLGVEP